MPAILRNTFNTNAILGTSFEAAAPADTENPVLTGAITVGAKTSSTIAVTCPTATDNVGVTGYEWSSDGGATYTTGGTSYSFTSLTALTSYNLAVRAFDAAGNRSTALTATTSTYRAGALGTTILLTTGPVDGNPAGILYNDVVSPADDAKWFSFVITTPPATGTLSIDPDGTFTFTGAESATMFYQLEVDGANFGSPVLVTLYEQTTKVSVVQALGWSLRNRSTANEQPVGWSLRNLVNAVQALGWTFEGVAPALLVGTTQVVGWTLRNYADAEQPLGWSLRNLVEDSQPLGWTMGAPRSITPSAQSVLYPVQENVNRALARFFKQPGEIRDFDVLFSNYMDAYADEAKDTLAVEIGNVPAGIDLLEIVWVPSSKTMKFWSSGGTNGKQYTLTAWLNTKGGRRLEVDIHVISREIS